MDVTTAKTEPLLPSQFRSSIALLYAARGLRGFGDGFAVILPNVDADHGIRMAEEFLKKLTFILAKGKTGCDAAQCVAWDYASATTKVKAGETYYIVVDGYDGANGKYALTVTCTQGSGLLSAAPTPEPGAISHRIVLEREIADPANPPPGCAFHPRCLLATARCAAEVPPLAPLHPAGEKATEVGDDAPGGAIVTRVACFHPMRPDGES